MPILYILKNIQFDCIYKKSPILKAVTKWNLIINLLHFTSSWKFSQKIESTWKKIHMKCETLYSEK